MPKLVVIELPSEGKPSKAKCIAKRETVTRVGLDLAKNVFQLHGVDASGAVIVAMEACSSEHHWERVLAALGFEVKLTPPAYVKPYVRRNKNDAADAAEIGRISKKSMIKGAPCTVSLRIGFRQ